MFCYNIQCHTDPKKWNRYNGFFIAEHINRGHNIPSEQVQIIDKDRARFTRPWWRLERQSIMKYIRAWTEEDTNFWQSTIILSQLVNQDQASGPINYRFEKRSSVIADWKLPKMCKDLSYVNNCLIMIHEKKNKRMQDLKKGGSFSTHWPEWGRNL